MNIINLKSLLMDPSRGSSVIGANDDGPTPNDADNVRVCVYMWVEHM